MKFKLFLVSSILLVPVLFANIVKGEPTQEEKERVDLLRVRDIVVRSFSIERFSAPKSVEVSAEATFNQDEMTILVDNYNGEVVVSISGQSNGAFINESFYVNGSSEGNVDISSLESGEYSIEIDTANSSFVGKFVIED